MRRSIPPYLSLSSNSAVSGIKKKQLSEVRSMANPPAIVKLALESICLLLNESDEVPDWKTIRSTLNKDGFIPSIMNYDTLSMPYESNNFIIFYSLSLFVFVLLFFYVISFLFVVVAFIFYSPHLNQPKNTENESVTMSHVLKPPVCIKYSW